MERIGELEGDEKSRGGKNRTFVTAFGELSPTTERHPYYKSSKFKCQNSKTTLISEFHYV